jgi:hypothetical protein
VERIGIIALALTACSGGESWLRLSVGLADGMPQPALLRVTLDGSAQSLALGGKALPGSLIVRHLAPSMLAIEVDGLDGFGKVTSQASTSIKLHSGENDSSLTLGAPQPGSDGGVDLAGVDLAGADLAMPDLAAADLAENRHCPIDAIFCDDFESGDTSHWTSNSAKPAGIASFTVDGTHALGKFAFDGQSLATSTTSTDAEVEIDPTLGSPSLLSARFYVYAESYPGGYALFYSAFGGTGDNFGYAVGVDGSQNWVITQDQANSPDLHSTLAMTYNAWHCVELVVDYGGNKIELDVDGTAVIMTQPTMLTVPNVIYGGLPRAPSGVASRIWFDDFALASHRIGCE